MDYLKLAKETFEKDIYATETTGIEILEAGKEYAKCKLDVQRKHLNANRVVMGGAIFTLADFTFAVAANTGNTMTVSLCSQMNFLSAAKGKCLIAEAICVRAGKTTCFYEIAIKDEADTLIAVATITGFRKGE